jgi:transcriptional regulator with XRE-family HTH domain
MTFYRFDIDARSRKAGRLIGRIRSELLKALTEEKRAGLTQQELAQRLEMGRSVLNRQLSGESNLSLRSLADLAWALDREIDFELRRPVEAAGQNIAPETSTIRYSQTRVITSGLADNPASPAPAAET